MKSPSILLYSLLSLLTVSCTDNLTDVVGSKIRPLSDSITVGTDTFHVSTENVFVDYMYSRPDSFLLGTFYDEKYGSTQADILAQVNCPVNFKYPPGAIADSAKVVLYYKTWFGDNYSPIDVNIYEMNKKTFSYSGLYPTNLNPLDYTDRANLLAHRIFTAKDASKNRTDTTSIDFALSNSFVTRFFTDSYFASESVFTDFFKGLYITANYGASTMLNIRQIDLEYYYHYTYTAKSSSGADSIVTVNNVLTFPANSEVRQVNRFLHPETSLVKQKLQQRGDVNYVSSPANVQTSVTLPLSKMKQRMDVRVNNKKLTINSALLHVEATEIDSSDLAQPIVSYMLLIKKSSMVRFFTKNELPSDTCAILAAYTTSLNSTTSLYEHYYNFNVATLVANEFKLNSNSLSDLEMMLVPVRVATQTNSYGTTSMTSVKQDYKMSAVTIRSGKNESPMRINMVYSGF